MAYLNKTQVAEIIQNRPEGVAPEDVVEALRGQGHQLEGYVDPEEAKDPEEKSLIKKVVFGLADVTGVRALGEGVARAMTAGKNVKIYEDTLKQTNDIRNNLVKAITDGKKAGKDVSRLETALAQLDRDNETYQKEGKQAIDGGITTRDVVGSALRTAGTIASFGTYGAAAQGAQSGMRLRNLAPGLTSAQTVVRGAVEGGKKAAVTGFKQGGIFGALNSLGLGIQDEEKGAGEVLGQTVAGAAGGAILGLTLGGIIGTVGGAIQARSNARAAIEKVATKSNAPYVERIKVAAEKTATELGDDNTVKIVQARNRIQVNGQVDDLIKTGQIQPEVVYANPNAKILKPEVAQGTIEDVKRTLNAVQPGLGDDYARNIDINYATPKDIVTKGLQKLDEVDGIRTIERAGTPDARASLFTRDPKTGKIVGDVDAKKLMRATGLEDGDIAMIKSGTAKDKKAFLEMMDIADELQDNPAMAASKKPSQVAGRNALKNIRAIQVEKNEASRNIGKIVREQLASKNVKTEEVYKKWLTDLADDGVTVDPKTGKITAWGRYEDVDAAKSVLSKAHSKALRMRKSTNALTAHNFKGQLDELVDYGNTEGGLSGSASRLVKGLRKGVDSTLDASFDNYRIANERVSNAKRALTRIESVIGKKTMQGDEVLIERKVGGILQRMFSNNDTTAIDLTTSIDDAMAKLGLTTEDTITQQAYVARLLEDIYGAPKSSIAGRIAQGTGEAVQKYEGIRRLAKEPISTVVETGLGFIDSTKAEKAEALRKFIEQQVAN